MKRQINKIILYAINYHKINKVDFMQYSFPLFLCSQLELKAENNFDS